MKYKSVALTIQKWGNSLAIRIPLPIARDVHFREGSQIELEIQKGTVVLKAIGEPKMSLKERLELFDPDIHGGEVMATGRVGVEKF